MKAALVALAVAIACSGHAEARRHGQSQGDHEAGQFDYYALVMSWSPTYCASQGGRDSGQQCSGERPYAFVLHGLWPQYRRGWPQFCDTGQRPWVPNDTIGGMLDIMPSRRLIINQYRKHGTCAGLEPDDYFGIARKLFTGVNIPERYRLPERALQVSPGEVVNDFIAVNPNLKPEMFAISCGGRRFQEMRICFNRDLQPAACGDNESPRRLCSRDELIMPPVRTGRGL